MDNMIIGNLTINSFDSREEMGRSAALQFKVIVEQLLSTKEFVNVVLLLHFTKRISS